MSYKILTKNGVDNTNIDGARAEFFNSGMRNGIVRGAFSEGTFSSNASNSVYLDTCELRISGHRIIIDEPVYKTFSNTPANNTRYSFIAQVSVDDTSVVSFSIIIQDTKTPLRQDNLFATETGAGIYQLEIGRFTLSTAGVITDIVRTADVITGGGEDENTYIEIGEVTTTTLDEGIDAEVDVENVIDEQTGKKKTNFHFGIPSASGTVVNINGQHQETVNFDSEPQTQINELKSTNSTQGKDIDDLKNETLKKPASAPAKRKVVGISTNNSQELIDIDEALSETSENLVQNKVVTAGLNDRVKKSEIDTALSSTSENPVQNKVITNEFDKKIDKSKLTTNYLWEGSPSEGVSYNLSKSLSNFTFITVRVKWSIGGTAFNDIVTIPTSMCLNFNVNTNRIVLSTDTIYFSLYFPNANTWACVDFYHDAATTLFCEIYGLL